MRIGFHLQALRPGQIGGLETYVRQLVDRLPRLAADVQLVLFCGHHNAHTFVSRPAVHIEVLDDSEFAALDAARLQSARLDLWFCPLLVLEPHDPGLPSVVTIPDMQHTTLPQFFSDAVLAWRHEHYARSAVRADAVLTLSAFSQQQIIDTLHVSPSTVHAIYLAAGPWTDATGGASQDHPTHADVAARYQLHDEFLLYPANNWPHKNHATLFHARRLAQTAIGHTLALILVGAEVDGREPWAKVITPDDRADGVRHLGYVPVTDLAGLYALSRALVFPSLFEGFGMPVLEAMRAERPVVCSDLPSLREICGNAARYVDPASAEDLAAGIVDIWTGADRHQRVADGRERAALFSWERTAQATLAVFRSVATPAPVTVAVPDAHPPLFSVVTPSLNQGAFIEETIRSVLDQDYPHLEYWVLDGGSTDGTREILERYQRQHPDVFHYLSEPDAGQAAAVNRGLELVRGAIVGWLNSDDTYEPGTLAAVARTFSEHPDSPVVYGRARHVSRDGRVLGEYPTQPVFRWEALIHQCYLCQPAVFMGRAVLDAGYRLDEQLHLCLDYDLWIRLGQRYRFTFVDRHLANSRVYQENKSLSQQHLVLQEAFAVIKRHYGWLPLSWATAWAHYHREDADAFFNVRPVTKTTYVAAFWVLVQHNWAAPQHWRKALYDVRAALTRSWRKRQVRVWPSSRRTLRVPAGSLIVEMGVDTTTAEGSASIDVSCGDQTVATLRVTGPGRHTKRVGVPQHNGRPATKLTLTADALRTGYVRVLPLEPFPAVSEDGWLQQRDTLRLPEEWRAATIDFMVPGPVAGLQITFRHDGQIIDEWSCASPGTQRRTLGIPQHGASVSGIIDIDVTASAALPPEPARGETRSLAVRILDISESDAEDPPP